MSTTTMEKPTKTKKTIKSFKDINAKMVSGIKKLGLHEGGQSKSYRKWFVPQSSKKDGMIVVCVTKPDGRLKRNANELTFYNGEMENLFKAFPAKKQKKLTQTNSWGKYGNLSLVVNDANISESLDFVDFVAKSIRKQVREIEEERANKKQETKLAS